MKKKIIFFDNNTFPKGFLLKIKHNFRKFKFLFLKDKEANRLLSESFDTNAIINCPRKYFTEELIRKFIKLDWVHTSAAGVDEFMNPLFIKSNITFTNGKILQGPEVADHAVGLVLTFSRNIHYYFNSASITQEKINRPIELFKKRALIIGFGGIGKCIAERLSSFGMYIDVISEELPELTREVNKFYSGNMLKKIASNYEVIISSAPLTPKTIKIFDYKFFQSMKNQSIFVNVSRGRLVDTNALIKKNVCKKLLGIGLDVTDPEPLPKNHPLRKIPNVIITNHTAGLSDRNRLRAYDFIYENLHRYYYGNILLNQVNKIEGY